jgi:Tetratricopeptide repeat
MKVLRSVIPAALLFCSRSGGIAAEATAVQVRVLTREALAAREAGNLPQFLEKIDSAAALRPDYPRLLVNLAEAQLVNGQPEQAVATLTRLAALGVNSPVDKAPAFAALRERDDFKAVVKRLTANLQPVGDGEIAFSLPGMTGLIEGVAYREKTRQYFFGDVHHRGIWVRAPDGKVRRFTAEDAALFAVFGVAVDEAHNTLWAATSAVPAMRGYTPELENAAGLAEFDLETGELRGVRRIAANGQPHILGDLAVAPDGSVFASDSAAPVLWKLAPGAAAPEIFLESEEFVSLQGLAFNADGSVLYLADYSSGPLGIDLGSRKVWRLESPANTTLIGLDGLARAPNGDLLATQNGVRPMRVLRLALDAGGRAITGVTVLEAAHLTMASVALGCVAGDDFVFIGNSGWSRFEDPEPKETAPRPVPIFRTKLESAAAPKDPAKR